MKQIGATPTAATHLQLSCAWTMQLTQLGPYRLGKKLGQGGMGAVYAGVENASGEPAAIKVLAPSLALDEGFRVRFEAEIESLKKLSHPNIVRLYGYGEQGSTLFYAMELVEGTSLEAELRAGRRFDWREVTQIAIKLCRALKHAHDHGVIHRDLKPANLLLTPEGDIKLSDFGIARMFGNARVTGDGGVLGTAEYMAPEQADGRTVTDRCDQYSLGGVMYALLAGRPPFRAKSLVEMLQLQRFAEPELVTRFAPQTPAELARIVHQLLQKEPADRFANTLILSRSLEAMERGLSISLSRGDDFVLSSPENPAPSVSGYSPQSPTLSPSELLNRTDNDEMQVTEATMAYVAPADKDKSPAADASDTSSGRFTTVEEERATATRRDEETSAGLFSPQTLLLVVALGLVLLTGWYMMQPPHADKLFRDIETATADADVESLKTALPNMELFLKHYPDDPRAEQVCMLQQEAKTSHPVQRALTEAKRLSVLNPELAVTKFQALIDVYDDGADTPESARHGVKLAKLRLKDLQRQIAARVADDRKVVETRLAKARSLTPQEARWGPGGSLKELSRCTARNPGLPSTCSRLAPGWPSSTRRRPRRKSRNSR